MSMKPGETTMPRTVAAILVAVCLFAAPAVAGHTGTLRSVLRGVQPGMTERECARLLADLQEQDSLTEQTLQLLRKLEGQYPQMPQIAAMLNFSPRTFRRRLEEEKQSFQALLDQVRAEHATRYLKNTRMPLSSIAYLVGFNDASNFRRAFRKWTGKTPRQVRSGVFEAPAAQDAPDP